MVKKSFKVGNRVVGKIIANRDRQGTVVGINAGPSHKLFHVRWDNGKEEFVSFYAISHFGAAMNPPPVVVPAVELDSEIEEQSAQSTSSDDSSVDSDEESEVSIE